MYLVAIESFCPLTAKWKKGAVTVAGFSNGIYSNSLGGLQYPTDFHVDADGNMYIADAWNSRIMYWAKNAVEGRIIIGLNESDLENDEWFTPWNIIGNH